MGCLGKLGLDHLVLVQQLCDIQRLLLQEVLQQYEEPRVNRTKEQSAGMAYRLCLTQHGRLGPDTKRTKVVRSLSLDAWLFCS